MTICHYYAFMLFSVSTETPWIVNFYIDKERRKKTQLTRKTKVAIFLPLLSEVTIQSDFHTLTQHVMQFHIQGYKCQKKNASWYSLHCFIIKLSMEITKDWKGRGGEKSWFIVKIKKVQAICSWYFKMVRNLFITTLLNKFSDTQDQRQRLARESSHNLFWQCAYVSRFFWSSIGLTWVSRDCMGFIQKSESAKLYFLVYSPSKVN